MTGLHEVVQIMARPDSPPWLISVASSAETEATSGECHASTSASATRGRTRTSRSHFKVSEPRRVVLPHSGARARDAPQPPKPLPRRRFQAIGAYLIAPQEATDVLAWPRGAQCWIQRCCSRGRAGRGRRGQRATAAWVFGDF